MSRAAVREAVSVCLEAVLTATSETARKTAEQDIRTLEVTEEYGVVLAELTASPEVGVAYRQLASVLLRQYLETHWSSLSDKFTEPLPTDQAKEEIRQLVLVGLGDPERRLRATVAYCIAVIARWDWPEAWPQLLPRLESSLLSGDSGLVHGAMRVLTEFCRDVSDIQMPRVAPVILPQLLRVLLQPQTYGPRTQARAVNIFHTMSSIIYATRETTPTLATSLFFPALPQFVQAFIFLLSSDEDWAKDPGLRRELLMTSSSLLLWFPVAMETYVMDLVTPVWKIFLHNTPHYVEGVVNCDGVRSDDCDSDGELVTMETCVFAVFEFISSLVESRQLRKLLPPILPTLTFHLISYMQPTHSQVDSWIMDASQFVEEDEQVFSYSIRLSAQDLLDAMWEEPSLRSHTHSAITSAVEKHLETSSRERGSPNVWKVQEACLLALSCVAVTPSSSFSPQRFTETVVMPTLQSPTANPLLLGRCLWLAGKMAGQLQPNTQDQLLQSLAAALHPSQHLILRVMAAKAAYNFCAELQASNAISRLLPVLPSLLSLLVAMTTDTPDVVLLVVIDALQFLCQVDEGMTARHSEQLSKMSLSLFLKYSHDPGISSSLDDLFSVVANNSGCHGDFHRHFLPSAMQLLESNEQSSISLVPAVLDVVAMLVRGCGERGVPSDIVTEIFPRVVTVAMASDDVSVLQNAGECVRAFVAMAIEDLARWYDNEGVCGMEYIVRLAVHLLDPVRPESSAALIGRFLIVFIKKAGNVLGDHLQLLLRSVLSKMQSVKTASVMQSLLLVYAYLLRTELEAVVSFLCQVPDPRGQPALNYVLQEWTSQHPFFFGSFDARLSTVALCQLLSHCVTTGNQLLCNVVVEEEEMTKTTGILTRSRKASLTGGSTRKTAVPLPVKIVRLLISDLRTLLEAAAASDEGSEVSGEEDEEEEEEEGGEERDRVKEMEALLRSEEAGEWAEPEEDPDLRDDPVLQLDLQSHLVSYLQGVCQLPFFNSVRQHLRHDELITLSSAGILSCSSD